MTQTDVDLEKYFSTVKENGSLISVNLARRWSEATLKMMGLYMGKQGKKALSSKLPKELADDLNRVFRLMHFPNTNMPLLEFQQMVARRSGHSDWQFAKLPIIGVFHALKTIIDNDTSKTVADSLSPEIREAWNNA